MACNQTNLAGVLISFDDTNPIPFTATETGGDTLFMSDNPETITFPSSTTVGMVLWNYTVDKTDISEYKIRAYLWHLNKVTIHNQETDINIGLTIQNLSATSPADDLVIRQYEATRQYDVSGDYFDAGKCIAKATLGGTQETFLTKDLQVPAGATTPVKISEVGVKYGDHLFACYELTIRRANGEGAMNFILRSACCVSTESITGQTGIPPEVSHGPNPPPSACPSMYGDARGTWQYSRIRVDMSEPYVIGSGSGAVKLGGRIGTCTLPKDAALFDIGTALQPNDVKSVVANKGMYAVDYDPIVVMASNPTPLTLTVNVYIATNLPSGGLAGAMGWEGAYFGIPLDSQHYLKSAGNGGPNAVLVQPLTVNPNSMGYASFSFQVGGESSSPWEIVFIDQ